MSNIEDGVSCEDVERLLVVFANLSILCLAVLRISPWYFPVPLCKEKMNLTYRLVCSGWIASSFSDADLLGFFMTKKLPENINLHDIYFLDEYLFRFPFFRFLEKKIIISNMMHMVWWLWRWIPSPASRVQIPLSGSSPRLTQPFIHPSLIKWVRLSGKK